MEAARRMAMVTDASAGIGRATAGAFDKEVDTAAGRIEREFPAGALLLAKAAALVSSTGELR